MATKSKILSKLINYLDSETYRITTMPRFYMPKHIEKDNAFVIGPFVYHKNLNIDNKLEKAYQAIQEAIDQEEVYKNKIVTLEARLAKARETIKLLIAKLEEHEKATSGSISEPVQLTETTGNN